VYAVRFANQGTWEAETGYNHLQHTIQVSEGDQETAPPTTTPTPTSTTTPTVTPSSTSTKTPAATATPTATSTPTPTTSPTGMAIPTATAVLPTRTPTPGASQIVVSDALVLSPKHASVGEPLHARVGVKN